jgi:hypothetical protein
MRQRYDSARQLIDERCHFRIKKSLMYRCARNMPGHRVRIVTLRSRQNVNIMIYKWLSTSITAPATGSRDDPTPHSTRIATRNHDRELSMIRWHCSCFGCERHHEGNVHHAERNRGRTVHRCPKPDRSRNHRPPWTRLQIHSRGLPSAFPSKTPRRVSRSWLHLSINSGTEPFRTRSGRVFDRSPGQHRSMTSRPFYSTICTRSELRPEMPRTTVWRSGRSRTRGNGNRTPCNAPPDPSRAAIRPRAFRRI